MSNEWVVTSLCSSAADSELNRNLPFRKSEHYSDSQIHRFMNYNYDIIINNVASPTLFYSKSSCLLYGARVRVIQEQLINYQVCSWFVPRLFTGNYSLRIVLSTFTALHASATWPNCCSTMSQGAASDPQAGLFLILRQDLGWQGFAVKGPKLGKSLSKV